MTVWNELNEFLKTIPFFQHVTDAQLEELIALGQFIDFDAGTTLFKQGDAADCLYVILSGKVRVFGQDPSGQEVELSVLETGDFFGELALVDGGRRSATIRTLVTSEFFLLNRQGFIQLLIHSPELLSEVMADISDKVRSSNEKIYKEMLERQKVQSEMEIERHRSLAQMVAGVAHEINTPLGIVNVSASMISENLTPELVASIPDEDTRLILEDIVEAAGLMQNNIARANKLIQTFKSISVNQITDTLEKVNLPVLVEEITDLFKIKARQAGIVLNFSIDPDLHHVQWLGYPGYLSQILLNLLSNIERYAYPDNVGGEVDIRLLPAADSDDLLLQVQDYGAGMPPEHVARIFDVFFTTGRDRGGSGLGMAIVHNLVTSALQGQIDVESEPGKGTCFNLVLPRELDLSQQPQGVHAL
ncbi:MAG TPA: cyclic nucleotide-binding domain-containing protein [Candidatus Obscuribacterales bacterium]